jgi:uncharacterized membrane protein YccF (DUF307 family)
MKTLANLLWFILGGWAWGLLMLASGALWCLTIIGIPFGIASFRLAKLVFFPFGKEMVDAHDVGEERILGTAGASFLWIIFYGLWASIALILCGIGCCCTLIGIPFGIAYFKIAVATFNPLGKRVVSKATLERITPKRQDVPHGSTPEGGVFAEQARSATTQKAIQSAMAIMPIHYCKMTIVAAVVGLCFILFGLLFGFFCIGLSPHAIDTPPPPVTLDVRKGVLSEKVLLPRNTSNLPLHLRLYIYSGKYWKASKKLTLNPAEVKQVGVLEFGGKWRPEVGNKGLIQVDGFTDLIHFELTPEGCHTELIRKRPIDFPGKFIIDN